MTCNEIICGALEPMGLPVAEDVYHGDEDSYFVFSLIYARPAVQGDDEETETVSEYYVSLFTRRDPGPLVREAKTRLRAAGVGVNSVNPAGYDDGTSERAQRVLDCFVLNNDA